MRWPWSMSLTLTVLFALNATAGGPATRPARLSLLERLSPAYMARFDQHRAERVAQMRTFETPYPLVRGTFHMHSELSHDSRGKIEEVVAAAKATGTKIVGFTEHPRQDLDVIAANVRGWRDGVYFLAGTESDNTLFWPGREGETGLRFVSHPEELRQFDPARYAGMEIYNTHSDAKDEPLSTLLTALLLNLPAVKAHPEAAFASFLDYPADFLARFDDITRHTAFTGIAANDSHQNQGFRLVLAPDGSLEAFNAEDESIWKSQGMKALALRLALGRKELPARAETLAEVQLDPYRISMGHVGTFLQIDTISERSIRQALRTGRVVIAFESVAPLPCFGFWIEGQDGPAGTMGDRIEWEPGLSLRVRLPLAADVRILRDGQTLQRQHADALLISGLQPGAYRVEAHLQLAGELRPWVLSNPIYVHRGAP